MDKIKKKDGFTHERSIIMPNSIMDNMILHPLIAPLYITDIGYFPKAKNHYRNRSNGCINYILLFCIDGCGIVEVEGQTIVIEKNHLIIIEAHTPHIYHALKEQPWSIYWIHFNGTNAAAFISLINKNHLPSYILPDKHGSLIKQFNQIYAILETGYSTDNIIHISNMLGVFLSDINHSSSLNSTTTKQNRDPINRFIEFMLDNVDGHINLNQLTHELNLSKSYLVHIFKENTGFSPIDYFIHLKIQKACQLLDTNILSVKQIACQLGYDDPHYFSRIFKKTMGLSPTHYRKIEKG